MAAARKCDICGKFYEPYNNVRDPGKPNGIRFLNIASDTTFWDHEKLDCCPECIDSIKTHLENIKYLATLPS